MVRVRDWLEQPAFLAPARTPVGYSMARYSCLPRKKDFQSVINKEPFSYAIIGGGEGGLNYNWFVGHQPVQ